MPEVVATGPASDTIHALATAPGAAAIAVIRLSGPDAHAYLEAIGGALPPPRRASVRRLAHKGETLDEALVLTFDQGASFTGEPMVEIQCHGGRAVVDGILDALADLGSRIATPGEFTRRAVMAGRMDLVAAEGLGDLISAETAAQRRQALGAMGGLTSRIANWRAKLIEARALLEVTIDWADEEVPEDVTPQVISLLDPVITQMNAELSGATAAERLRVGYEVAILGAPNVGKSSLLNTIAGRDVAIVSDAPGTTRDVLEVRCDLNGLAVTFLDTAGLRETQDTIEAEGVRRAMARAEAADLRILLQSPDTIIPDQLPENCELWVSTKIDVFPSPGGFAISTRTGQGVDVLLSTVSSRLAEHACGAGLLGHRRQVDAVREAHDLATTCRHSLDSDDIEARAEDLRLAVAALDRLTGRSAVEDMLDVVFSKFCLGK